MASFISYSLLILVLATLVISQRRPIYPEGRPPRRPDIQSQGKPGFCPPVGGRPGRRQCNRDENCPNLEKCCPFGRFRACTPGVFGAA